MIDKNTKLADDKPTGNDGKVPTIPAIPVAPKLAAFQPFTPQTWKGVKTVYKCGSCEMFQDAPDEIILHYLTHFPKAEQDELLERLVQYKSTLKE